MYDINGVTVEGGKRAFFGPEAISNAIRGYHNELGEGKNTLVRAPYQIIASVKLSESVCIEKLTRKGERHRGDCVSLFLSDLASFFAHS